MKILVICQYYHPEHFRINDICPALVREGNQVTVLTGLPNYPVGQIPKEYKRFRRRKEFIDGVEVIRCLEIGRGNSKIRLALNYISYMIAASLKVLFLRNDYDVVFVYQLSPLTMAVPAIIYKSIHKKKIFLYCQDLWPESLKAVKITEKSPLFKLVHQFSKGIYRSCDYIGVSSKVFVEYLENVNRVSRTPIEYIPQHAESLFERVADCPDKDQIDFLFAGNIGRIQGVECIIYAVAQINTKKKYKVNFVGDGSFLEEAKELVNQLNIQDQIIFHGRYPVEKMVDFYSVADAFLITLKGGTAVSQTIPSKLQSYMAAGKPVFGAIDGAARELVEEANCGCCVCADDVKGLSEIMERFIANSDAFRYQGANGRRYFMENFRLENYNQKIQHIFTGLKECN